jgi:glyoxylase I family protein
MIKTIFSHIGLTCRNPGIIENFYTKYFNFKRVKVFDTQPDKIVLLKSDNIYLELFKAAEDSPVKPPEKDGYNYPGFRHMSFLVDNLDVKLKEFDHDIKITLGPLELDNLIKGFKACWIKDPEGNIIELTQGFKV